MLSMCEENNSYLAYVSNLMDKGMSTIGLIGRAKAMVTKNAREVASLARELVGGNGVILDYNVMKHFMDIEGIYTYEGTYDINMLVSGRELTGGLKAIK